MSFPLPQFGICARGTQAHQFLDLAGADPD
jgi:hypothetical protein